MTTARSNSMGAKKHFLFQLCWHHSLWTCALCPLFSICVSLTTQIHFSHPLCCPLFHVLYFLSNLLVLFYPFYLLTHVCLSFLPQTISLLSSRLSTSLLSASQRLSPSTSHYNLDFFHSLHNVKCLSFCPSIQERPPLHMHDFQKCEIVEPQ